MLQFGSQGASQTAASTCRQGRLLRYHPWWPEAGQATQAERTPEVLRRAHGERWVPRCAEQPRWGCGARRRMAAARTRRRTRHGTACTDPGGVDAQTREACPAGAAVGALRGPAARTAGARGAGPSWSLRSSQCSEGDGARTTDDHDAAWQAQVRRSVQSFRLCCYLSLKVSMRASSVS